MRGSDAIKRCGKLEMYKAAAGMTQLAVLQPTFFYFLFLIVGRLHCKLMISVV